MSGWSDFLSDSCRQRWCEKWKSLPLHPNPSTGDSFAISVATNNRSYGKGGINANLIILHRRENLFPYEYKLPSELRVWCAAHHLAHGYTCQNYVPCNQEKWKVIKSEFSNNPSRLRALSTEPFVPSRTATNGNSLGCEKSLKQALQMKTHGTSLFPHAGSTHVGNNLVQFGMYWPLKHSFF